MNERVIEHKNIWEVQIPKAGVIGLMSPWLFGAKQEDFPKTLEEGIHSAGGCIQTLSLERGPFGTLSHHSSSGVMVSSAELIEHCTMRNAAFIPLALIQKWVHGEWQAIEHRQMLTLRINTFDFCTFAWDSESEKQSRLSAIIDWAKKQTQPQRICVINFAEVENQAFPVTTQIAQTLSLPIRSAHFRLDTKTHRLSSILRLPHIGSSEDSEQAGMQSKNRLARKIKDLAFEFARDWRLGTPLAIALIGAVLMNSGPLPKSPTSATQDVESLAPTPAKSPVWRRVESLAEGVQENGSQDLQGLKLMRKDKSLSAYSLAWEWPANTLGANGENQRPTLQEFEIAVPSGAGRSPVLTQQDWQEIAKRRGVLLEFSTVAQGWSAAGPGQPIDRINGFLAEVLQPQGSWKSVELRRIGNGLARFQIEGAAE